MEAGFYKKLTSDVRNLLYLSSLSDEQKKIVTTYIDEYLVTWDNYLIDSSFENSYSMQLLSGPVNEIYNLANPMFYENKKYPAVELIKSHINEYGTKIEKEFETTSLNNSFTRVLSNQSSNKGHSLTEDYNSKAAFWQAPLIMALSTVFGTIIYFILR